MLVLPMSAVDLTPSESDRKTWFSPSLGFPFTPTHLLTNLFHFIFALKNIYIYICHLFY